MPNAAERLAFGRGKQLAQELQSAIKDNAIYFHAHPFLTPDPLVRFSHVCSDFVFCDPDVTGGKFHDWVQSLDQSAEVTRERLVVAREEIMAPSMLSCSKAWGFPQEQVPWIGRAAVERKIGEITRKARVWCLHEEASVVYERLFPAQGQAPRVLDLLHDPDAPEHQGSFTQVNWPEGLRKAVTEGDVLPELLVNHKTAVNPPWNALWQEFPNWGLGDPAAFSLFWTKDSAQHVTRVNKTRTVEVKSWPLTPLHIEGADAVFMDIDQFHRHHWPDKLLKIVNVAPECLDEALRPEESKVVALDVLGRNMEETLRDFDTACEERQIKHLATIPFGLADEAAELDHWASREGPGPRKITFFAELPGDYTSLVSNCSREEEIGA